MEVRGERPEARFKGRNPGVPSQGVLSSLWPLASRLSLCLWLLATGLCYTAVLVSPAVFWPAAFMGMFGVPLALGANAALLAVSLIKRRRAWAEMAFFCLLVGYPFIRATFAWGLPSPAPIGARPLRVISFNTGNFLGHSGSLTIKRENATHMMRWFRQHPADVLVLQEVFNYALVPEFRILNELKKAGYTYRYWSRHTRHADTAGAGMVILSRVPVKAGKVCFALPGSNNQIIRAEIAWQGRTLRIINAHLQSIQLTYEDMAIRRQPRQVWKNIRHTFKKMRKAYVHRAHQVETLANEIDASPYPLLLCGDFNDTPYSYSYWRVRAKLASTFEHAGSGLGNTYNGKFKEGLRIDHQFYSRALAPESIRVVDSINYSDHFALDARYYWK